MLYHFWVFEIKPIGFVDLITSIQKPFTNIYKIINLLDISCSSNMILYPDFVILINFNQWKSVRRKYVVSTSHIHFYSIN